MAAAIANPLKLWTGEDLLAMPDDGVERWIIRGQLHEKPSEFPEVKMTVRNRHHSRTMSYIAATLVFWLRTQSHPRGEVYCGEAGVRLRSPIETTVGVDVVYAPPDVVAAQSDNETTLLDGTPTLAIEILSPSDTHDEIESKIDEYLDAGVPLVWTVNTYRRMVTIFRKGSEPALFSHLDRLPEHLAMPGFTPTVAELFQGFPFGDFVAQASNPIPTTALKSDPASVPTLPAERCS
jgi:Uma2 family endonuclease